VAALEVSSGSTPLLWLVILAIAMSCVSLYYYLQVLKHAYVATADDNATPLRAPILTQLLAVALALAVAILGCAPHLLLGWFNAAIAAAGL
jgi:NADH-quinone oxidoreductase subunit N